MFLNRLLSRRVTLQMATAVNLVKPRTLISYKNGDLFSCPEDESLVHCVSADLKMGKGIATKFKETFGGVDELKKQNQKTGGCAVLKIGRRYVYYLVTKPLYYKKPTYATMESSLQVMLKHCQENNVKKISMPQIGAGLDKLDWKRVKDVVEKVFCDSDIGITVYIYKPKPTSSRMKKDSGPKR